MPEYLSPGVYVNIVPSEIAPIAGVSTSTAGFVGIIPDRATTTSRRSKGTRSVSKPIEAESNPAAEDASPDTEVSQSQDASPQNSDGNLAPVGEPRLCTNFTEFKNSFGGFDEVKKNYLAHAVYGFFNNGGKRCYVMRYANEDGLKSEAAMEPFEPLDDISLVVAPGVSDLTVQGRLIDHCAKMEDRFAILDSPETISGDIIEKKIIRPGVCPDAAYYFPWIEVYDPASKENKYVAPSGHIAGVYARVDIERGVHKAPANEVIRGVQGVKYPLSKFHQSELNPLGINCIRFINGNYRVWGARTLGGDANTEWKYVNVRRLFLFLRESIDKGTQWVVFEPNSPSLWAKITRNVTAFLLNVWRDGALFGNTPQEAFYIKCDEETNPPETRELGRVVTEIGVAVVRPAEFVIFNISQWAGPAKS